MTRIVVHRVSMRSKAAILPFAARSILCSKVAPPLPRRCVGFSLVVSAT